MAIIIRTLCWALIFIIRLRQGLFFLSLLVVVMHRLPHLVHLFRPLQSESLEETALFVVFPRASTFTNVVA
jgi:predicted cobalt transporter CbtA